MQKKLYQNLSTAQAFYELSGRYFGHLATRGPSLSVALSSLSLSGGIFYYSCKQCLGRQYAQYQYLIFLLQLKFNRTLEQ
jgi:hypothetical protein